MVCDRAGAEERSLDVKTMRPAKLAAGSASIPSSPRAAAIAISQLLKVVVAAAARAGSSGRARVAAATGAADSLGTVGGAASLSEALDASHGAYLFVVIASLVAGAGTLALKPAARQAQEAAVLEAALAAGA